MLIVGRGRRRRRHLISRTTTGDRNSGKGDPPIGNGAMARHSPTYTRIKHSKYWTVIVSSALIVCMTSETSSNELQSAWRSNSAALRNIRHLPCVSRRTGETGLCMFAYSCAKANGTHLGTCIDRFYFGSCCKINANSDPDLVDPVVHNYLNKDDPSSSAFLSTRTPPYQRPSSGVPADFSFGMESSSTMSLPVSVSSISRPLPSVFSHVPPSSTTDLFTSMFVKQSSTKPASAYTTSTISYETVPITSRTPVVNVTMLQSSYSTTPATLVTSSMSTVFQTGTHKPLPAFQTTAYSKPFTVTKPTSKPGAKPKPTTSPGKPASIKPKPVKPVTKPSLYTTSESPYSSPYVNKTTIFSSSNGAPSKPIYTTENAVPTKTSPRPSSQAIPTPITSFTSFTSKKPTKPTKPSTIYTTTQSPTTYIKIPAQTHSQTHRPQTIVTSSSMSSSTYFGSTIPSGSSVEQNVKFNNSIDDNEITEKPPKPWTSSTSMFSTRPWMTQSSSPSTPSQPALVTWTTIEEVPAVVAAAEIIPTDRTKPPKPLIKPTSPKPTIIPTFSKPLVSSTGRPTSGSVRPPTRPTEIENNQPPPMTMTSSTSTTASTSWVQVPITTHPAPTMSSHTSITQTTEIPDLDGVTMTMISQSKPSSTSVTIPVVSPLPIDTTLAPPSIETNEIESSGLNMSDYKAVCGRRMYPASPTARIVGGEKATFGEWPWQISLRQWRTSTYLHKCGAALFNENWAVTAAHCVENVPPGDLLLRLGEYDLSVDEEPYGYQERRVQIVASHPQFDPRTFEYDLALLRFYEPVKFQPNIIPICVPEDDTNFVGSQAFVTGWGRLYEDGPLPSVLQEVSVPVINNSVCESMYQSAGYIEHIPNIFICAGWKKGGYDSCEGDSGGPMVIQRPDKRWLLAGIISWGIGCAEPNQPGVYTRISEFRDWINQILQF